MRAALLTALASIAVFAGCGGGDPAAAAQPTGSIAGTHPEPGGPVASGTPSTTTSTTTPTTGSTTPPGKAPPVGPPLEILQEEVYVLMEDFEGGRWLCTGTLISKDRVITAGHCLEEGRFTNYTIVAPLASGKPRVKASKPTPMSNDFADVSNPDVGFLTLDSPINLPAYAELTDISERVANGEKLTATAIVRTAEELEAPFHAVENLNLKSTTADGYDHGLGVNLFSHGGDSGAGLFLVEDGHVTHKMIGVARQPDPDTSTDELTRIDADVLAWLHANDGE